MSITKNDSCDCTIPNCSTTHDYENCNFSFCDVCGLEEGQTELYKYNNLILCADCLTNQFKNNYQDRCECCACLTSSNEHEWYCELAQMPCSQVKCCPEGPFQYDKKDCNCDECGEIGERYLYEGEWLCKDCLLEKFDTI